MPNTKWDYFWNRYKLHATVIVVSACIMSCSLHNLLTQKETILSAAYINAFPNADDEILMDDFESYLGEHYNIFCSYRREDTYDNKNYISDGLNNAEIIQRAKEFIQIAKKELNI